MLESGFFNAFVSANRLGECCGYISDFSDEYEGEQRIGEFCGTVPTRPSSFAAIPQVIEEADAPDGDALDQFSEGMVKVDEKAWREYVVNLARAYAEPAEELATGMDKQQLEGFSKAVKELEKGSKAAR